MGRDRRLGTPLPVRRRQIAPCFRVVAGVDARGPQRVAPQVQRLGTVRLRDAGVADQHVS